MWIVSEETIHMNCQSLIFGDNKKKNIYLPSAKITFSQQKLKFSHEMYIVGTH